MLRIILVLVLTVSLTLVARSEPASRDEAEARRLIQQLASESYAEREAASKGLVALGEKAARALKEARIHPDPEVRSRVARLLSPLRQLERKRYIVSLQRKFESIQASSLSEDEKARHQMALFSRGMTQKEIETILGFSKDNPSPYEAGAAMCRCRLHPFWFCFYFGPDARVSRVQYFRHLIHLGVSR